jgi:putative ABC transport system ATP-binding protein/lipoprotein-releasing system ATP-binding protein
VAVVGPSGSGKSTLLHLIAGIEDPTDGDLEWPAIGPKSRLRPGPVAMAFQGPSLLPPLSVLENVALPILLAGGEEAEADAAAERMLERFGLAGLSAKLPEELSGGQSERAGVARALAGKPRLLLADEPTGQQDGSTGRMVMQQIFDEVGRIGAALVVATHDGRVASLFDQVWSMRDGRLETGVVARSG